MKKMRRRCEKRISAGRVGGRPRVREELLEFVNRKNSSKFAMSFKRPVPCEQGAADCYPLGSSADPTKKAVGLDLHGFVRYQSENGSVRIRKDNDFESLLIFVKVCVFASCLRSINCCSVIFDIWRDMTPNFFVQVKKIGPWVAQGMP